MYFMNRVKFYLTFIGLPHNKILIFVRGHKVSFLSQILKRTIETQQHSILVSELLIFFQHNGNHLIL